MNLIEPYKDKIFQITDGAKREFLHPLTPVVRKGWILKGVIN